MIDILTSGYKDYLESEAEEFRGFLSERLIPNDGSPKFKEMLGEIDMDLVMTIIKACGVKIVKDSSTKHFFTYRKGDYTFEMHWPADLEFSEDKEERDSLVEDILHELAHIYLHTETWKNKTKKECISVISPEEISASYFARAFYLPRIKFLQKVREVCGKKGNCSFHDLYDEQEFQNISKKLLYNRGVDLGLWQAM